VKALPRCLGKARRCENSRGDRVPADVKYLSEATDRTSGQSLEVGRQEPARREASEQSGVEDRRNLA